MALHLVKLCVGCDSIRELDHWIKKRIKKATTCRLPNCHVHITRMTPKRNAELLDGGSLYWVIKGEIMVREKLLAIEPFYDKNGIGRCRLMMEPKLIAVSLKWTPW